MTDCYQAFVDLYRCEWQQRVDDLGDPAATVTDPLVPQLPDVGPEAQQRRAARWQQVLDQLDRLDTTGFDAEQLINVDVYTDQIQTLLARQQMRLYERPANADSGFWMSLSGQSARRLHTVEDARSYIAWMRQLPAHIDQQIDNMRAGTLRGFGPAQISMIGREATIASIAEATTAAESPYAKPLATLPDSLDDQERICSEAAKVITEGVTPAHRRLLDFFTGEYVPGLPTAIAVHDHPGGEEFYLSQLREFTTTELSPAEIHRIGLDEVAKIRGEMAEVATQAGFLNAAAMIRHLRSDPSFVADTAERLLQFAAWQAKKFDAVAHHYFGRLPRMRFGITEPAPELAPYYTAGRGGPHTYILNTYNLPARKLYSIPALTLHEAAPGHAFQIPFALEMDHPDFRRKTYISAYGEGWALYAERLGVEMDIYDGPFQLMGMLSYQMWRAVRLVIDPGLHALGWTREQAQDYLRDNTALSDHEIVTEVDRYIAWPGQACAYYLGMMKIIEVRRRAEEQLGERFSLPAFHDQVLSLGSVPLPVLERAIEAFIARGGTSPFAS